MVELPDSAHRHPVAERQRSSSLSGGPGAAHQPCRHPNLVSAQASPMRQEPAQSAQWGPECPGMASAEAGRGPLRGCGRETGPLDRPTGDAGERVANTAEPRQAEADNSRTRGDRRSGTHGTGWLMRTPAPLPEGSPGPSVAVSLTRGIQCPTMCSADQGQNKTHVQEHAISALDAPAFRHRIARW
jgi:hypothetical protein